MVDGAGSGEGEGDAMRSHARIGEEDKSELRRRRGIMGRDKGGREAGLERGDEDTRAGRRGGRHSVVIGALDLIDVTGIVVDVTGIVVDATGKVIDAINDVGGMLAERVVDVGRNEE